MLLFNKTKIVVKQNNKYVVTDNNISIIINYGNYNTATTASEVFPIAFTSNCYAITAQIQLSGDNNVIANRLPYNVTTTGFDHHKTSSNNYTKTTYIAIGY